ncbi:MAG: hydroxyacid dehydrogenase [Anaerolineae bacterium]|nr:hydroxyacid dehydrogenase [Anaerolineae bacterium]
MLDYLQSSLDPHITLTTGMEISYPANYHILVAGRPRRDHLSGSPNLHTLIIPWAGLPSETRDLMLYFPNIAVHNLHHNAEPVAEMTVALLLAAAKFIVPMDRALRSHDWRPRYGPNPAVLLGGKTALILGYGAIGRRVGRICMGLGMQVLATRRSVTTPIEMEGAMVYPASALHNLLPGVTALIITLPLTPETEGLIGAAELALLSPRSVLVNVGRGAIVQESALYKALRDGMLHAAGLDVWYTYPRESGARVNTPPSAYPFGELDNVVLSPHRAGALGVQEAERKRMIALATALNAAAREEPLPNPVNVRVGY